MNLETVRSAGRKLPRFSGWIIATVFLVAIVAFLSRQQLETITYKASLVAMASVLAYWIDRSLFADSTVPRLCNHSSSDLMNAARLLARALVYLGTALALTLGL